MLEGRGWTEVRRPQLDKTRRCWRARSLSGAPGRRQWEEVGPAGGGEVAWREGEIPRGACLLGTDTARGRQDSLPDTKWSTIIRLLDPDFIPIFLILAIQLILQVFIGDVGIFKFPPQGGRCSQGKIFG